MLINLTNHPYEQWNEAQKIAAEEYGRVEDMPFPQINPECCENDLNQLVDTYYCRVTAAAPKAVLLQGEFVFCYRLIRKLKESGITVIAAGTKRCADVQTDENGNTVKRSVFRFAGFREY